MAIESGRVAAEGAPGGGRAGSLGADQVAADALGLLTRLSSGAGGDPRDRASISTGFLNIDACARVLRRGELAVVTGAPGAGKSAFALNLASNAAMSGAADSVVHIGRDGGVAEVTLAKGRSFPPQTVRLAFVPEYLRFLDLAEG